MNVIKLFPALLLVAVGLHSQTQPNTPTDFEEFVASQPASAVHKQLVGRLVDDITSLTLNAVEVRGKSKEMRGLEFALVSGSKSETVSFAQERLAVLWRVFIDGSIESDRRAFLSMCKERGTHYAWDARSPSVVRYSPRMHTMSVGWLFTGGENLGTMIQTSTSDMLFPFPNTSLFGFFQLLEKGFSQLSTEF